MQRRLLRRGELFDSASDALYLAKWPVGRVYFLSFLCGKTALVKSCALSEIMYFFGMVGMSPTDFTAEEMQEVSPPRQEAQPEIIKRCSIKNKLVLRLQPLTIPGVLSKVIATFQTC